MDIEKIPTHTVPNFLKEFIEKRNTDLPEILEGEREGIEIDTYFRECDSEEIHINLPSNEEAYNLFSEELKRLESIELHKMGLEDIRELLTLLDTKIEYYSKVDEIYDKAKFLITNPYNYHALHEDNGGAFSSVIYDEEKQLLKTLVNTLSDKWNLAEEYIENYGYHLIGNY